MSKLYKPETHLAYILASSILEQHADTARMVLKNFQEERKLTSEQVQQTMEAYARLIKSIERRSS